MEFIDEMNSLLLGDVLQSRYFTRQVIPRPDDPAFVISVIMDRDNAHIPVFVRREGAFSCVQIDPSQDEIDAVN